MFIHACLRPGWPNAPLRSSGAVPSIPYVQSALPNPAASFAVAGVPQLSPSHIYTSMRACIEPTPTATTATTTTLLRDLAHNDGDVAVWLSLRGMHETSGVRNQRLVEQLDGLGPRQLTRQAEEGQTRGCGGSAAAGRASGGGGCGPVRGRALCAAGRLLLLLLLLSLLLPKRAQALPINAASTTSAKGSLSIQCDPIAVQQHQGVHPRSATAARRGRARLAHPLTATGKTYPT